jgi:putative membrane protein
MVLPPIPYCGSAPVPAELWLRWNLDLIGLATILSLLLIGRSLRARPEPLVAGCAVLAVLFVSPFCALTSALFSARTAHHILLTAVAAPLLATAMRGAHGRPAAWAAVHALIFWAWHAPAAYSFALQSDAAYWLMELTLLGSAIGLWRSVLAAPPPTAVAVLLGTMVQMGLLGALLTFASAPLYARHWTTTQAWRLSPLEDQQLAGLLMWIAGGALYLLAALRLASRWLAERQRKATT